MQVSFTHSVMHFRPWNGGAAGSWNGTSEHQGNEHEQHTLRKQHAKILNLDRFCHWILDTLPCRLFFWAVSKHGFFLYWPMSSYLWGREGVSPDLLSPGVGADLLARGGTCGRGTDKDGRSQSRLWCRQTSSNNRHVAAASVRRADQRDTRAAMVVDWKGWGLDRATPTDEVGGFFAPPGVFPLHKNMIKWIGGFICIAP